MFQCQNESCPSHETNLPFPTMEKSRALAINCASVLGFRAIDGGHATVSKVFSFFGLSPINRKCSVFPPRPASPVKCLLLLQDDPSLVNIKMDDRCYNPIAVKTPQKIYFSCFLGTKILES